MSRPTADVTADRPEAPDSVLSQLNILRDHDEADQLGEVVRALSESEAR